MIAENAEKAMNAVKNAEQKLGKLSRWETEENLFSTIKRTSPALLYTCLVSKTFLDREEKAQIQERLSSCLTALLKEINNSKTPEKRQQVKDNIKGIFVAFRRAITYGSNRNNNQNLMLLNLLRTQFNILLGGTRLICKYGDYFKEWSKLSKLVNKK